MQRGVAYVVVGGAIVGTLAWVDPLFVPLVLLGPLVTGVVAGRRGAPLWWVAGAWALGGVTMVVSDSIVNHEDVAFHVVLTVVMTALSAGAWWVGRAFGRRRSRRPEREAETA